MVDIEKEVIKVIDRIKTERNKQNKSQATLAAEAGLAQSFYSGIESGASIPTIKTLFKISDALNVHPSRFFIDQNEDKEKVKEEIIKLIKDKL